MKKLFIIAVLTCAGLAQDAAAQQTPGERMYVATDKDNYLAGEIVWMKLITTDVAGAPQEFSKVGYVELVGERDSHARARIDMWNGTGEGTLVIPASLPTGWYRLVGYTRWMRNEGPEVFFDKRVGVVNPAIGEVPRGGAGVADGAQPVMAATVGSQGGLRVTTDRDGYSPRSGVRLEVTGIPADIHTLAVSVTAADPLGGFTRPGIGEWRPAPATSGPVNVDGGASSVLEAEWEGAIVTGRLVSSATGERVYSPVVLPLASFPGDEINMFGGDVEPDGSVVFRTRRVAGYTEIVTTMRGNDSEPWSIDVDDPFAGPGGIVRPMPSFPLDAIDGESVRNASFAMQVQYSYVNDSLSVGDRVTPLFNEPPHDSYNMDEWRRFATMEEVFIEIIQLAQFRRSSQGDGKRYVSVLNSEYSSTRTSALVMLDGVPVLDHDIIYNYNPLLISRIDVYTGLYNFGENVLHGVVALYTERNSYPELRTDPVTQIASYAAPQARWLFYAPDYSDPARAESRLPDFRHTLYWDADVATRGDGSAEVSFWTSDLVGSWQVLVEGITAAGVPVSAVCSLEVR